MSNDGPNQYPTRKKEEEEENDELSYKALLCYRKIETLG